jgi:hypothetical protein
MSPFGDKLKMYSFDDNAVCRQTTTYSKIRKLWGLRGMPNAHDGVQGRAPLFAAMRRFRWGPGGGSSPLLR